MKWEDAKKRLLENEEFRKEYENSEFEYQVKCAIIDARINQNLTTKELAEKAGIKQATITKFQTGSYVPTCEFLYNIVRALGKEVKISIV